MKAVIYGDVKGTPLSHKIWSGKLSALPRPDDTIVRGGNSRLDGPRRISTNQMKEP